MEADAILDELDILVERGIYKDREALLNDAMRSLLRSKPGLRVQLAMELYRRGKVSFSRASEIAGVDIENLKEHLQEAAISRGIPQIDGVIRDEVEELIHLRESK
jgi:predicted HTH domain antitoxin